MIEIKNLQFGYSRKGAPLFSDFSLSLSAGQVVGLLGKNGAGKSTLIYLMAGLLTPDAGQVTMHGVDVRRRLPSTLADVFVVPEEFELPSMSLNRYVAVNAPFYPRFSMEALKSYLDIFEMDGAMPLKSMSMGQRKKSFICFALASGTSLLLLDERTIVVSTHQVRDIDTLLDHVVIVDRSRVLLDAGVREIGQRLTFGSEVVPDALYVQSTPLGPVTVSPNLSGLETPIDMELLFNAALTQPARMKELFTRK